MGVESILQTNEKHNTPNNNTAEKQFTIFIFPHALLILYFHPSRTQYQTTRLTQSLAPLQDYNSLTFACNDYHC
eukprot:m.333345 g.333345  ORF g.333345 m.333345 type:complete len:74 (+) comp17128_c0_seq1:833-1054(+)